MHVAAAVISLHIYGSSSLKDKRRVVHSVLGKLRARHSVAAAEVDSNDSWQSATIGISVVSGDIRTLHSMLDRVVGFVESAVPEAEVIDVTTEIWSM